MGRHAETCQATDAKVQGLLRCPRQALQAADVVGGLARPVAAPAAAAATAAGQQLLRRDGGGVPPAAWRGTTKTKHHNSVDAARSQADCVCINHFTLGVGGKLTAWETDQFPNPLISISHEKATPPPRESGLCWQSKGRVASGFPKSQTQRVGPVPGEGGGGPENHPSGEITPVAWQSSASPREAWHPVTSHPRHAQHMSHAVPILLTHRPFVHGTSPGPAHRQCTGPYAVPCHNYRHRGGGRYRQAGAQRPPWDVVSGTCLQGWALAPPHMADHGRAG